MISKRNCFLSFLLLFSISLMQAQQDTVSLRQCLSAARDNALVKGQLGVLSQLAELKTANVKATNLPSLKAYGKATYQSEALNILMPTGGIEIDPFQYNAGLEASQKLYDGGLAGKARELEASFLTAETEKINAEVYKLVDQVTELFFKLRLLDKTQGLLMLKEEILHKRMDQLKSAHENGFLKRNELNAMEAEILALKQQQLELEKMERQLLVSLSGLTSLELSENSVLELRDSLFLVEVNQRPERIIFDAENQKLESMAELQKAKNLPKLYAFGQAGYSYPGLNFYENQSDYYYIVGAKLSWTIYDWKQNKREVEIIRAQKETVDVQKAVFNQQIEIAAQREKINQEELASMIELDKQIIAQRKAVTLGSEVSLYEGTITSADYLEDLNMEIRARIEAEYRKIELQHSVVQLKILEGIDLSSL